MGQKFRQLFSSDQDFYANVLSDAQDTFRKKYGKELEVVTNESSRLMRACAWVQEKLLGNKSWLASTCVAWWVTFFRLGGNPIVYMPSKLVGTKYGAFALVHEAVHLEQMRRYTTAGFLLAYFVLWLPVAFSMRTDLELAAYAAEILTVTMYSGVGEASSRAKFVLDSLTGRVYFWPTTDKDGVAKRLKDVCVSAAIKDAEVEAALSSSSQTKTMPWQDPTRDTTPLGSA